MNIAYLLPVATMPTAVNDIGKWYNYISHDIHNVVVYNLRESYWDKILSNEVRVLFNYAVDNSNLHNIALLANKSLYELKNLTTFTNGKEYIEKITNITNFLNILNKEASNYSFDLLQGIRVKELNYEDSTDILRYIKKQDTYYTFIKNIVSQINIVADLLLVQISSKEELLNTMMIIDILKEEKPTVHVCLVDHSFETYSLNPYINYLKKTGVFSEIFDTIIEFKHEKDVVISLLIDELTIGKKRKGIIRITDFPEVKQPQAKYSKLYPLISSFNSINILSTRLLDRGCYWGKCTFCNHNIKHIKQKPTEIKYKEIVERLEYLKLSGYTNFVFTDEALPIEVLENVSNEIIKRNLKIKWSCRCRLEFNQEYDFFCLLKKAGCFQILYGLESISTTVIDMMNKYDEFDIRKAKDLFNNLHKAGLGVHVNLMVGFPNEKPKDALESVKFLINTFKGMENASFQLNRFTLFTGSKIFNVCNEYDIEIIPKKGDIIHYWDFKYLSGEYKDINYLNNLIKKLSTLLYDDLGWNKYGKHIGTKKAIFLYFNTGYNVTFKLQEKNEFKNPLKKMA